MAESASLPSPISRLKHDYWPLIKSRQTFLLAVTGAAGYLAAHAAVLDWLRLVGMVGSLLVTISGCTVLNMVFDRDIDGKMERTRQRPLAANRVGIRPVAILGAVLVSLGSVWALLLSMLFGGLVLLGAFLDVVIYTLWLKRRSAWSILWGGFSGGVPILAGRALAVGRIDTAGLLLGLAILCWIPSHNLSLGMLYSSDFLQAGVPTFLNVYGEVAARAAMAISSLLMVGLMEAAFHQLNFSLPVLIMLGAAGLGLLGLAVFGLVRSSHASANVLYKYSSVYMLAAMILLGFTH